MPSKPTAAPAPKPAPSIPAVLETSTQVACIALGPDLGVAAANALGRRWLGGAGRLAGTALEDWLPEATDRALVQDSLPTGRHDIRLTLRLASGERLPVAGDLVPGASSGAATGLVLIVRADDGRARLLAGIERSARLEALGSLASGVAHDFNNLLTILVGNLALVAEELRDSPKQFVKIKAARDAAKRGGDLIGQLLRFARQQPAPAELIEPGRVIAGIAPLLERALGRRIRLELDIEAGLEPVNGNAAALESVVVNLAINARDAIGSEGTVRIGVGRAASGRAPGDLCIEVADDGAGIAPELVGRIFEPFFTTKPEGQGSGLGLSMVKAYAESYAGRTELVSEPGEGTIVRLLFPMRGGRVEDSAAMTMPIAALPSGNECILLAVDEDGLAAMLQQILAVLGYRCRILADHVDQADPADPADRAGAGSRAGPGDLIISDRADAMRWQGAATRADGSRVPLLLLLSVGDGDESVPAGASVLRKPFSLPDLALAVRRAL